MKKQILFALALLCLGAANAQPVLNQAEDFNPGMEFRYIHLDTAFAPGSAGAGITWDFSQLALSGDTLTKLIVDADSTFMGAFFPTADYAEVNSDGSLVFVQKSAGSSSLVGVVPYQGFVINYYVPNTYFQRPMSFGQSFHDTAGRDYFIAGSNYIGSGLSNVTADAWGTLIVGGQTYLDVLRVRTEQHIADTSEADSSVTQTVNVTYAWYTAAQRSAILKMDSMIISHPFFNQTTLTTDLLISSNTTAVGQITSSMPLKAWYAAGRIFVQGGFVPGDRVLATIYDLQGRTLQRAEEIISTSTKEVVFPAVIPVGTVAIAAVQLQRKASIEGIRVKVVR